MNEQANSGVGQNQQTPVPEVKRVNFLKTIYGKIPEKLRGAIGKFYSNKKVFWPVVISFGLIMLTILAGLVFGGKNGKSIINRPTPTPESKSTPAPSPEGDAITNIENKLKNLKEQIDGLDPRQSRLQFPAINFSIRF